jgi:hypothetical protein
MATTTRSANTRIVALDQLILDKRAFPRAERDQGRVDEFADLYRDELPTGNDPFPPIGCVEDRDGRLVLYDGWHRVTARRRVAAEYPGDGYDELPAEIVRAPDGRDAVDYAYELAIECSARGSKPLTHSERVTAAIHLGEIRPDLSAREIGRRLGISHMAVCRARGTAASTGGTRVPTFADRTNGSVDDDEQRSSRPARGVTLEQQAWRAASELCQLLDQARGESRGMLGMGKPNMARAGAAVYRALEHSYGEDAPAVTDDLLDLVNAMQDQAVRGD